MPAPDQNLDALLQMERYVRLMGIASSPTEIVSIVSDYLASWPKQRVLRLQATDAGWLPFDANAHPFPVASVDDVRRIWNSVRIRCRDLQASGRAIAPDLAQLDFFLFFVDESLEIHRPSYDAFGSAKGVAMPSPQRHAAQTFTGAAAQLNF